MSAEPWVVRLAPEPFRDFLPYTSPSALKVIHATQVVRRAVEVAKHFSEPAERAREAARLTQSLEQAGLAGRLCIADEPGPRLVVAELTEEERSSIGASVLALYFHLLNWDGPLFLDLRPRHFAWDRERGRLAFYPSSLWCRPDPDFMGRLRSLYVGFYCRDAAELARGTELYSWDSKPSPGYARRIELLLRNHFGPGETAEMRFSIATFRNTFDAIFKEAADSRAKLHPDLAFLGVELVGLYLTLESLNVSLNPRRAFDGAR